jgi:hypothetical protein
MKYPNDESAEEREARLAEEEANKVVPGAPAETVEDQDEAQRARRQAEQRRQRPVEGGQPPEGDPNAA